MIETYSPFEEKKQEIRKRQEAQRQMLLPLASDCLSDYDHIMKMINLKDQMNGCYNIATDEEILRTNSRLKRNLQQLYTSLNFVLTKV